MPRPNAYNGDISTALIVLEPPTGLPEDVRRIFAQLVAAADRDHFAPAECPLLVEYCRALARCSRAESALSDEGEILKGKPNPWLMILRDARHQVGVLATKLRLATNARTESKQTKGGTAAAVVDFGRLRETNGP